MGCLVQQVRSFAFIRPAWASSTSRRCSGRFVIAYCAPPRRHRHQYYGAFAPHAALRAWVSAHAGRAVPGSALMGAPDLSGMPSLAAAAAPSLAPPSMIAPPRRRASSLRARLIARIYECLPLSCPRCGADMKLIAFITEPITIRALLTHRGGAGSATPARAPGAGTAGTRIRPHRSVRVRR